MIDFRMYREYFYDCQMSINSMYRNYLNFIENSEKKIY